MRPPRAGVRTVVAVAILASVATPLGAAAPSAAPVALATARVPIRRLSPHQLAGQRVIYSYDGLTPPVRLLEAIRAGEAAGVIFFGGNISSRAQIRSVIGGLQHAAEQSPVKAPLLMMTDQEGGAVRRLAGGPVLSEKRIGASDQPASAARHAGRDAGLNLKAVGMNVNLAPVLDVYRTRGDFLDRFGRSYSTDPQKVARLGGSFISAQQHTGVAATAKHFPGLGVATRTQNTDERPVTLNVPLEALRGVDEVPYRSAISAGARLVMVSWATYPALDSHRPAGISSTVIEGELRRRLKFTGVTITDALGAAALRAFGAVPNRAVLAARAGMDLVLCAAQDPGEGAAATNALAAALRTGRLERPAFMASIERTMALRLSLIARVRRHSPGGRASPRAGRPSGAPCRDAQERDSGARAPAAVIRS